MERLGSESERYLRQVVSGLPIWVRGELQAELRDHLTDGIRRPMPSVRWSRSSACNSPRTQIGSPLTTWRRYRSLSDPKRSIDGLHQPNPVGAALGQAGLAGR